MVYGIPAMSVSIQGHNSNIDWADIALYGDCNRTAIIFGHSPTGRPASSAILAAFPNQHSQWKRPHKTPPVIG